MLNNETIRIFIGFDQNESVAYHTLVSSIMRRASRPVSITPISMKTLGHIIDRPRDPLQSNDFSFIRFLVPWLCGFEGRAIFMDCDMLVRTDIAELWDLWEEDLGLMVVKHDHFVEKGTKYLNTPQTPYSFKNWSSVMMFDCSKCEKLTPEYVNTAHGLDLHQFKWIDHMFIGGLPWGWNHLVGVRDDYPDDMIWNIHWTEGGPYFHDYADVPYAGEWWKEYNVMTHCTQTFNESAI